MDKTIFSCAKCDAQFSKWAGRCTQCGAWGTVSESAEHASCVTHHVSTKGAVPFSSLNHEKNSDATSSGVDGLDRVLSGGFVHGSVTLIGGEPGIGKSTLLAQVALALSASGSRVMYMTGEESPSQVERRFRRMTDALPETLLCLESARTEDVMATMEKHRPVLTIVGSVQTLRCDDVAGEPGNPTQIKASAAKISEVAKRHGLSVVLVGQVTKDGDVAGPRLLEHLVDTLLMMEGDRTGALRLLRALKHRFGPTDPIAIFTMNEKGLEEVNDPSAALLEHRPAAASGSVVTCMMEGNRPLLVEIQSLVTPSGYATPTRRSVGIDPNRLSMLLAVLSKRAGLRLHDQDIFVNVVGGFEARDPSSDLAIALAIASAKNDVPFPHDAVAWGEIGLAGELRPSPRSEARLSEATQHGFKKIICRMEKSSNSPQGINIVSCKTVEEGLGYGKG